VNRNGKSFEQPSETPEEIVGLLGNIGNRPDIRAVQERQVKEIQKLIDEAYARGHKNGFYLGDYRE
jgi:hypothetical protein